MAYLHGTGGMKEMTPEEVALIEKAANTKMWCGKYKDEKLEDVPSSYLRWMAEEWSNSELADLALVELRTRGDE